MALSDFIRKIEQSPRSTKVAAGVAGLFLASSALLLYTTLNQPEAETPPSEAVARTNALPAQPAPTATVPAPTPAPTATPKINTPTPNPTRTPIPTATPGPSIGDYYVLIRRGKPRDTIGGVEFCADYPLLSDGYEHCGIYADFHDEDLFMDYLLSEGTITPEQHRTYYLPGGEIELYLDDLAPAIHKLVKTRGYRWIRANVGFSKPIIDKRFLAYYDEHQPLGGRSVASSTASDQEGYVVITDGSMETVITNDDGGTSRVKIETVDTEDLLEYLLRQGKITVEQKNSYGETQTLEISLESAADALTFFDWEYSSKDGVSLEGVTEDDIDYIRRELLPLFLPD